jgi:radical SAM protein with 4Fe4S-binding SPASM domain
LTRGTPAIISLLHQPPEPTSVARRFRDEPVLQWTLRRLQTCREISKTIVLCSSDQAPSLRQFENIFAIERIPMPSLNAINASRRWSDGWRGGLLFATGFDPGFHAPSLLRAMAELDAVQAVLIDPDSALIDPQIVDSLLEHAANHAEGDYFFTPAAPGQSAFFLHRPLLEKMSQTGLYPGRLLNYHPDIPGRDPIALPNCAPVPTAIARTSRKFTLDSQRQIQLFSTATHELNGQLITTSAEQLLKLAQSRADDFPFPRDITVELNTARAIRPIYSPLRYATINRPPMTVATAIRIFEQLAAADDIRITLGGIGDPLLHPEFFDIIEAAQSAAIAAIHVETDFLDITPEQLARLAHSSIDILSVHIPAVTQSTYRHMMDCDRLAELIENFRTFLSARGERCTPILAPTFVKCRDNLGEMEAWYDHWLRNLGCAVIAAPSDCSAQIPDISAANMSPPLRIPCRRLNSRMTILSSGQVVACENDIQGRYALGQIGNESISEIWRKNFTALRNEHAAARFSLPICQTCNDWHRP